MTLRSHAKRLCLTAAAAAMTFAATPAALALPGGVSMSDIQAALSGPISVPAGQTTTVSLPVAVNAQYSGGGWQVSSAGNSVTITAPPEGGQISVPVTSGSRSATITLTADPAGAPGSDGSTGDSGNGNGSGSGDQSDANSSTGDHSDGASSGDGRSNSDSGNQSGDSNGSSEGGANGNGGDGTAGDGSQGNPAKPQGELPAVPGTKPNDRKPASAEDDSAAEYINIESSIEGNVITAQLSVSQAIDLYNRFKDTDQAGVTLRYVDADGNIIQGVERDIDPTARKLTLTYPKGQAPDNPFIMQLIRKDDTGVQAVVTLRDPHYASADADEAGNLPENMTDTTASGPSDSIILLAGAAVLVILLGIIIAVVRKLRRR